MKLKVRNLFTNTVSCSKSIIIWFFKHLHHTFFSVLAPGMSYLYPENSWNSMISVVWALPCKHELWAGEKCLLKSPLLYRVFKITSKLKDTSKIRMYSYYVWWKNTWKWKLHRKVGIFILNWITNFNCGFCSSEKNPGSVTLQKDDSGVPL